MCIRDSPSIDEWVKTISKSVIKACKENNVPLLITSTSEVYGVSQDKVWTEETKSLIGSTKKQISSMKGLGLRKINHQVTLNDTPEIRKQIFFMKECFHKVRNILAICWGMQVAVTAAGGVVKKSKKGAHIGIAKNININSYGLKHPIYKNKDPILLMKSSRRNFHQ